MASLSDNLRQHINVLAELIGERTTRRPSALDATRDYLRRELTAMGHAVVEQPFEVFDRPALNLEVVLPGRKPRRPTLVIGAHYDTVTGSPGADDNGSAVATLLEIARAFAGRRPTRTVRIVFYDCEEAPHYNYSQMGSQWHAARLKAVGERLLGMVCLESVGYFGPPQGETAAPWPLSWVNRLFGGRFIVVVSNLRSIPFGWRFVWRFATSGLFPFLPAALAVKWVPHIVRSDHRGYWEEGYRALMVTDTADLRNPNYHRPTDRLATLDLPRMTRLCRQLQRTCLRLAGA